MPAPQVTGAKSTEETPIYIDVKDLDLRRRPSQTVPSYPPDAERQRLSGKAIVDCAIIEQGKIDDCRIAEEVPTGAGFGETARAIFGGGYVRVGPTLRSGAPLPRRARTKFSLEFRPPPL
jgi:protein TonB